MSNPREKTFKPTPILVDIVPYIKGSTVIMQKALFTNFEYRDNVASVLNPVSAGPMGPFGMAMVGDDGVTLRGKVLTYEAGPKDVDGNYTYGERMASALIPSTYDFQLVANGSTLVDPATGAYICEASAIDKPESFQEGGVLFGKDYMRENEFFHQLASLGQVNVRGMLGQYIQDAAGRGRIKPQF